MRYETAKRLKPSVSHKRKRFLTLEYKSGSLWNILVMSVSYFDHCTVLLTQLIGYLNNNFIGHFLLALMGIDHQILFMISKTKHRYLT